LSAILGLLCSTWSAAADEPPLPQGLTPSEPTEEQAPPAPGGREEPPIPEGLEEPPVPEGLDAPPSETPTTSGGAQGLYSVHGFVDVRGGVRVTSTDPAERASLGEGRAQLAATAEWTLAAAEFVGDALYDPILDVHAVDLESGEGAFDLRAANVTLSPVHFMDLRVGRQIITWGTGDLVFINDLFPKDWTALLVGRHIEYLKAPSDAARLSLYTPVADLDVVWTPRLDADRTPDRRRLVSYDPLLGRTAGDEAIPKLTPRDEWITDSEFAARLRRQVGAYDVAAYGYTGFHKGPVGFDPDAGTAVHPELTVGGASLRGPLWGGIAHAEGGWHNSREDRAGDDPLVPNSQVKWLAGFEHELAESLTLGGQVAGELMLHHDSYLRTVPLGAPAADAVRHLLTLRLTALSLEQRLRAGLVLLVSPTDADGYLKPEVSYALDDHWTVEAGANLFAGTDAHTAYAQFEDNSNVWGAARVAW
jgi:hypothetical protein